MMEKFTLGVEEEYMVIDPVTRELKSHDQKIVELASKAYGDQVKAEMHQAVVEVGTNICKNVDEAAAEIRNLRRHVAEVAARLDLQIGASGTHPFSDWNTQLITPNPRYDAGGRSFESDLWVARACGYQG
jgi:carboxylate-amine ligase